MTKSSQSREGNSNKGSLSLKLGSSASGTTSRRTLASKVFDDTGSPLGLTEGSIDRWGRITKYTSLACLTLAILSTLVLNIVSSYSLSKIESNAIDSNSELSTLANDSSICNPTNTNAAACISLSITSSSSSSTGGNDANLSLTIPQGGGIATGRHTVEVSSNNVAGYYVTLTGNAGSPAMTPTTSTSQAFIQSTTGTLTNPSPIDKGQWGSWGIALPNSSLYTGFNTNEADYNSTNQDTLAKTTWAAVPGKEADDGSKTIIKTTTQSRQTDTYSVYYGVRVDNPVSVPADTYTAQVVYTATTNEVPEPTISNIAPSSITVDNKNATITINGSHLLSTYDVYVDMGSTATPSIQTCSNLAVISDSQVTCTLPEFATTGEYVVVIQTQGGSDSRQVVVTPPAPEVTNISPDTVQTGASKREEITLAGQNLEQVQSVFVDFNKNSKMDDGEECLELDIVSDSMATCVKPSGNTEGTFTLYVASSAHSIIAAGTLTYIYIGQPTITSVSPYRFNINVSQPGAITIRGQNLLYTDSVFVDLNENGSVDSWEECAILNIYATQVQCMAPESNIMGQFTLYLTTPGGRSQYNYIYYN